MKTAANTVKTAAIQNADDKKKTTRLQDNKTTRGRCYYIVASFFDERQKTKDKRRKTKASATTDFTDFTDFTDVSSSLKSLKFLYNHRFNRCLSTSSFSKFSLENICQIKIK